MVMRSESGSIYLYLSNTLRHNRTDKQDPIEIKLWNLNVSFHSVSPGHAVISEEKSLILTRYEH